MRAHDLVIILHCIYQVNEHFLNIYCEKGRYNISMLGMSLKHLSHCQKMSINNTLFKRQSVAKIILALPVYE